MISYNEEHSVMEEVRKRLDERYEGVEGEAYEILMHKIDPQTHDKAILLIEIELERSFGYLQVVYVDLKKEYGDVTIVGDHGLPADCAEYGCNLAKAIFSATVGRLCDGWK
ncbi:MAG: hypothetical protein ACOX33_06875 [Dethiobacteria bacterium]|jgi:hypothetical protein